MLARGVLRGISSAAWKTMSRLRSVPPPFLRVHQMGRLPVARSLLNWRSPPHARAELLPASTTARRRRVWRGLPPPLRFHWAAALMMARGDIACDFANSLRARVSCLPLHDGRNAAPIYRRAESRTEPRERFDLSHTSMQQRVCFDTHVRPGQHHWPLHGFVI